MENITKMAFAVTLKQERKKRNWTQRYLADQVGVDSQTVGRWERGETKPFPIYRQELCKIFDMTSEELGLSQNEVPYVYLAYALSDEVYAHRLGQELKTQGFRIWNDEEVTKDSPLWKDSLRDILRESQAVIAILSPHTSKEGSIWEKLALAEQHHCPVLAIRIAGQRWKEVLPIHQINQTFVHPLDTTDARKDPDDKVIDALTQQLRKLSIPLDGKLRRNPYKGLLPFGTKEEDAYDFFGRNQLIEASIDQLERLLSPNQWETGMARLLAFIGPSGVGKSSFVLAGLLPRIQAPMDELPGSSQWIYLPPMHPGDHPIDALKKTLGCALDDGPGSLRAALHVVNSGGTIALAPFLKGTIQLKSEDLNIDRTVTLVGFDPNFVMISSSSGKKIHISLSTSVTINNLSFKGSKIQQGSIIYNEGTLTCNNCIISDNTSFYNGGGITNLGGSLTINDSGIVNNKSSGNGGGIYNRNGIVNIRNTYMSGNVSYNNGGAIYSLEGAVTIDSSRILSNLADNSDGGGIDSVNGSLQLVDSTIPKNQSKGGGGGLAVLGSHSVIRQSSIYQNIAALYGGGLSVEKDSENDMSSWY